MYTLTYVYCNIHNYIPNQAIRVANTSLPLLEISRLLTAGFLFKNVNLLMHNKHAK